MILERVELCRAGRFVGRVQVGPFDPGLNILAAANEHGKSTLIRAAARCLFDRHTTRADEIRSLQPVGTDLAPEITVEFRTAQRRFRLKKRFLQNPESALAEWREEDWREMATGDAADQRVFEMLMTTQPGRGASKPEHWGLLRYLWARQDEPALWPDWDGSSGERIRRCLARFEVDPAMDQVLAGLLAECDAVFAPTGQVKKGGELFPIHQQLEQLDAELAGVRQRIQAVESQQDVYRQLSLELVQVRRLAQTNRAEADRLFEQLSLLALTRQEVASAEEQVRHSNAQLQALDSDFKRLTALRNEVDEAGPAQEAVREKLKIMSAEEDDLQARFRQADNELAQLDHSRQEVNRQSVRLRAVVRWRDLEVQRAAKRNKLDKISALSGDLDAKQRERTRLPNVTPKHVESLRALDREIRDIEIHLQAAGLRIELSPDHSTPLRVDTDRGSSELEAGPLAPGVVHARSRARIELPGWGSIAVTSGAQELRELETQLKAATQKLAESKERLGITSVDQAEQALLSGKDLDREIKALDKQLQVLLEEHESASAFRNALEGLETRLAAMTSQLDPIQPEERDSSVVELEGRAANSEAANNALDERIRMASAHRQMLADQIKNLLRERGELQAKAAHIKGNLERAGGQIHSIEQRYPAGIDSARAAARESFVRAEARLAVSKGKLPPDADQLPGRRDRAVRAASDAEQGYEVKRVEMNRLEGALGNAAAAGLFSQATDLEERATCVRAKLAALRRRAQAARFLRELLQRRKAAAVRTVLGPLEQRLSASFAELTGENQRSVFLDENLAILGVGRNREPGELVAFDNLSQGAKEQLLLCLRAAAAIELGSSEPQTLILDDVLVNTDAIRQTRVLDFLTGLAQHAQLIVLTCHPERYAGLGHQLAIVPAAVD